MHQICIHDATDNITAFYQLPNNMTPKDVESEYKKLYGDNRRGMYDPMVSLLKTLGAVKIDNFPIFELPSWPDPNYDEN